MHQLAAAPHSRKPYLRISYYDWQEWMQAINDEQLSKYELIRLKAQIEIYVYGRTLLQVPMIGLSYYASWLVMGPPMNRRMGGRREQMIMGTFFYILFHHWADQKKVPSRYLDEVFSQHSPHGDEIRRITKNNMPHIYEDFMAQLAAKGLHFPEPRKDD